LGLLVPPVTMGIAFFGVQVPLSPHDGAFHVEVTELMRGGSTWPGWYPPGLPATFAAVLQLQPWLDTAGGDFELGMSLTLLAPLVTFGLALVVWRNPLIAAVGALFTSLTYLFPYFPQIWSGWPLLMSLLLTLGLWIAGFEYLARPG